MIFRDSAIRKIIEGVIALILSLIDYVFFRIQLLSGTMSILSIVLNIVAVAIPFVFGFILLFVVFREE